MIKFEWDKTKNILNIKKHGIDFNEAATVFLDDEALLIEDEKHSGEEDRFVLLGFSQKANLLIVCHNEEVIRIISARKATKNETKQYFDGRRL